MHVWSNFVDCALQASRGSEACSLAYKLIGQERNHVIHLRAPVTAPCPLITTLCQVLWRLSRCLLYLGLSLGLKAPVIMPSGEDFSLLYYLSFESSHHDVGQHHPFASHISCRQLIPRKWSVPSSLCSGRGLFLPDFSFPTRTTVALTTAVICHYFLAKCVHNREEILVPRYAMCTDGHV